MQIFYNNKNLMNHDYHDISRNSLILAATISGSRLWLPLMVAAYGCRLYRQK